MQEKIFWNDESSLLIHIPHSSTVIPQEVKNSFVTKDLKGEIFRMTDWYTDELFNQGNSMIVFPISRLVCDVERFRDDKEEVMAKIGMGVSYTRCSDFSPLRTVKKLEKHRVLKKYYDPHHGTLTEMVARKLKKYGHCCIIDGHSFPSNPLPYEENPRSKRLDFCIGTDSYHSSEKMVNTIVKNIQKAGYTVEINSPFSGSIVPMEFYRKNRRVQSVMIEINRGLYMDERGRKTEGFARISNLMKEIQKVQADAGVV